MLEKYELLGSVKGTATLQHYTGPLMSPLGGTRIGCRGSGFGPGLAPNSIIENVEGFGFQYRAGQHENYGLDHVNLETISPASGKINNNKHIKW